MSETSTHIAARVETIDLGSPERLVSEPDAAFKLGVCPDGLPLLLHVRRSVNVRGPVLVAMRNPSPLPLGIDAALVVLEKEAQRFALNLGAVALPEGLHYESARSVPMLLGQTLFSRMLGVKSPMAPPESASLRSPQEERFENSALFNLRDLAAATAGGQAQSSASPSPSLGRMARLRVRLGDGQVTAAPETFDGDPPAPGRPIVWESLLALRSARFVTIDRHGNKHEGKLADERAYKEALQPGSALGWSVARVDVATLLFELARSIDRRWHAQGRVHGDLKPANVLLQKERIDAFDALDVASGDLSLGLTASWAAPEQILARPVTPATDIYALALMTVSLLQAAIYGEERTMIIPAKGEGRRRIQLILDPEVWLDPTELGWSPQIRVLWREFLMRCLAADPAKRPQRGDEFAAHLEQLLKASELPGRLSVECGPGGLEFLVGSNDPAWVLHDTR